MKKITITSGKGGVGKTSLAANLGVSLVEAGSRTILFDADLQLANVDVALGIQPEFTLQNVVSGEVPLSRALCEGPGGLMVIAGGSAVSALMTAGPKRMGTFFGQLDALSFDADFLLFDTSAGLDNRVITFCKAADEIIVITTPDPASVTDAYATVKVAARRSPGTPIGIIVNQASSDGEAAAVFRTLSSISTRFLDVNLSLLGTVSSDPKVASCTRQRKSFMVAEPDCAAARQMRGIAARLRGPSEAYLVAA